MPRRVRITGETVRFNLRHPFDTVGPSLGSYVSEAHGFDLLVFDPFGGAHVVSLAPFDGEDPDVTFIISYTTSSEEGYFDPRRGNAVVLKEYDLPAGAELPWRPTADEE